MTTRTISEMITITNSTRTAAATVSSERRAGGQKRDMVKNFLTDVQESENLSLQVRK
jgi:hypothetical protein